MDDRQYWSKLIRRSLMWARFMSDDKLEAMSMAINIERARRRS